jgi:thioredoxin reductase
MNNSSELFYDVVIIGGGPAGLSAALVLSRSCRKVIVVDAGHPRNEAARELHGFLSRDGIAPIELLKAGKNELSKYGCEVCHDVVQLAEHLPANDTQPFPTAFRIETSQGRRLAGRKLLFATGMRDELPDFPGVRDCYGATVHHCPYCDGWEHRDQRLVAYAGDVHDAVGLGIALRGWSPHVTVLANGQKIGTEDHQQLAKNNIQAAQEPVARFLHEKDQLLGVELQGRETLPADALFFSTTQRSSCDLPQSLGVKCDDQFTGHTTRKQKTNVPGLFLAGDADGDVQFAIVAAAEGATAAVAMNRELADEDRE